MDIEVNFDVSSVGQKGNVKKKIGKARRPPKVLPSPPFVPPRSIVTLPAPICYHVYI